MGQFANNTRSKRSAVKTVSGTQSTYIISLKHCIGIDKSKQRPQKQNYYHIFDQKIFIKQSRQIIYWGGQACDRLFLSEPLRLIHSTSFSLKLLLIMIILLVNIVDSQIWSYPAFYNQEIKVFIDSLFLSQRYQFTFTANKLQSEAIINPIWVLSPNMQLRSIAIVRQRFYKYINYFSISSQQNLKNTFIILKSVSFIQNSQEFSCGHVTISLGSLSSGAFSLSHSKSHSYTLYRIFLFLEGFQINQDKFGKVGQCTSSLSQNFVIFQFSADQIQLSKKLIYGYLVFYEGIYNLYFNPIVFYLSQVNITTKSLETIYASYCFISGFSYFSIRQYPLSINSETQLAGNQNQQYSRQFISFTFYGCIHMENCINCINGFCLSCKQGYYLMRNICFKCQGNCVSCDECTAQACYIPISIEHSPTQNSKNSNINLPEKEKQISKLTDQYSRSFSQYQKRKYCGSRLYFDSLSNRCAECSNLCAECIDHSMCLVCQINSIYTGGVCLQIPKKKYKLCLWPTYFNTSNQNCLNRSKSISTQVFDRIQVSKRIAEKVGYVINSLLVLGFGQILGDLISISVIVKSHLVFSPLLQLELGFFLVFFDSMFQTNLIPDYYSQWASEKLVAKQQQDSVQLLIFPRGYHLILTLYDTFSTMMLLILRIIVVNLTLYIINFFKAKAVKLVNFRQNLIQFFIANIFELIFLAFNQLRIMKWSINAQLGCLFAVVIIALGINYIFMKKYSKKQKTYRSFLLKTYLFWGKFFIISQTVLRRNQENAIYFVFASNLLQVLTIFFFRAKFKNPLSKSFELIFSSSLLVSNYFSLRNQIQSWVVYFSISVIGLQTLITVIKGIRQIYKMFKSNVKMLIKSFYRTQKKYSRYNTKRNLSRQLSVFKTRRKPTRRGTSKMQINS